MTRRWVGFMLVGVGMLGCAEPVDIVAKRRIFSAEDPPKVIAAAAEPISLASVSGSPAVAARVLNMGAAEATERLGSHRYVSTVSFEWSTTDQNVKLVENRVLLAGSGGVYGDFHAVVDNSRDQGFEVVRVNQAVYARGRHGQFRQRLRDRGVAERMREETYRALRDFEQLFLGRIELTGMGDTRYQGRPAEKFNVTLAAANHAAALPVPETPLLKGLEPKGGRDHASARRIGFFSNRQPEKLRGEITVDTQTGVVLKAELDGRMTVKADKSSSAQLKLILSSQITDIAQIASIPAPKDFLTDADKPSGIAAALERFGFKQKVKPEGAPDELDDEG